jgi:hypothetical protein
MIVDEKFIRYISKLAEFNPDTATDEDRAIIMSEGLALIKDALNPKPKTMQDLVDAGAARVNTGSVNVPAMLKTSIEKDIAAVDAMIKSQRATREAYAKGIGSIVKAALQVTAMVAVV